MLITTETGSIYQFDLEFNHMRRLSGAEAPTPRTGSDGDWRLYESLALPPTVGQPIFIIWGTNDNGTTRTTITSRVETINDGTVC